MKLWAISDLHLRHEENRRALAALPAFGQDWIAVVGDVGEAEGELRFALEILGRRFARVLWVPGNHDLWSPPSRPDLPRGEAKYQRLVAICREHGALTPEDPYPVWRGDGGTAIVAPLFLLYDYSFRPDHVPAHRVLDWAAEDGILCADEALLAPDPHPSRAAWCAERCRTAERRLALAAQRAPLVLINHWPLRQDLLRLRFIPRFSPWCGTRRTEDWHRRFRALVVVHGHLHVRGTQVRDGVRFEEVSLGYPRNWNPRRDLASYLRQILPPPGGGEHQAVRGSGQAATMPPQPTGAPPR